MSDFSMLHFRLYVLLLILGISASPVIAQTTTSDTPLSERRVSYRMDVTLDPDARTVSGSQRLTWRNPDNVPVDELQFHLYLNAFRNNESTFMRESGGQHRGNSASDDNPWGGIEVRGMRIADDEGDFQPGLPSAPERDLTDRMTFIQPDDGNPDDLTVMSVALPQPVGPGETIALDITFDSRLPEVVARTGWKVTDTGNPLFMVAQWFPKIAVYEIPGQRYVPKDALKGAWNAHQFHENSEFYADFGTYDVTMTVPEDYVVGASGLIESESNSDGQKTVRYLADDVHDFAWTASQDYLVFEQQWQHVAIRALVRPAHKGQGQRHIDAAVTALERYADWVGEYPYTTLTVVDAIGGANGMEYPTLITSGTAYALPQSARFLELVTIHEFGHQYFYGLLASNEFEEAWLDEGMNSYIESRIMDDAYPGGSVIDFGPFELGDIEMQRLGYVKDNPSKGALFTSSWEYSMGDYGKASYPKPATVMNTLERYWGWEMQREFLRTYYDTWRFRHPTTRDLQDVAESVSEQDLDWFFGQFVYGTAVVDQEVVSILNTRQDDDTFRTRVRVRRNEDGVFPTTLQVRTATDSTFTAQWDGVDQWKDISFSSPSRVVEAWLDPDRAILLDINHLNNRMVIAPEADNQFARKAQLRAASFFQTVLFVLGGLS
ncbi:MAG: M1 family metallopeptidase [Bacteroidetes bacterium]|nr:M1 family metallopeptidase [Bacteroidota bacterium]